MMRIKYKKLAKSLTGFSTPIFGLSWHPPETDREIVRKLITFLEDRRVLYNPYDLENPRWVNLSLVEIRAELTSLLSRIGDNPDITPHFKAMRAACRKYLDELSSRSRPRYHYGEFRTWTALGELRATFGIHVGLLATKYGIDIEKELASILPTEDE
jgi:hypothetical protein